MNPPMPQAPTLTPDQLLLAGWLLVHPGLHTAKEISADLGMSDRTIRALAAGCAGVVISGPGMGGYIHRQHATPEQKAEAIARLNSQAKRMQEKARQIANA